MSNKRTRWRRIRSLYGVLWNSFLSLVTKTVTHKYPTQAIITAIGNRKSYCKDLCRIKSSRPLARAVINLARHSILRTKVTISGRESALNACQTCVVWVQSGPWSQNLQSGETAHKVIHQLESKVLYISCYSLLSNVSSMSSTGLIFGSYFRILIGDPRMLREMGTRLTFRLGQTKDSI